MQELILVIILIALSAIFVLLIYLTDRVRRIEQAGSGSGSVDKVKRDPDADPHFWGLTPRQLWDGMSGKEVPGWTAMEFDEIRHRYEYVLNKHVDELFQQGRKGTAPPKGDATSRIRTLRGFVVSWMPSDLAKSLHQLGSLAAGGEDPADLASKLDETCRQLFGRVQIKPEEPCSKRLLASLIASSGPAGNTTGNTDEIDAVGPAQSGSVTENTEGAAKAEPGDKPDR